MAIKVTDKNIIPYNQDEIEAEIKKIYKQFGVSDVDYEGSNAFITISY